VTKLNTRPYVLYVHDSQHIGGCEGYRMLLPADTLRERNKVVDYVHWRTLANTTPHSAEAYDIYVLARSGFNQDKLVSTLKHKRKKFVLEVDDDFTNRYREVVLPHVYKAIWNYARETADAIICSTTYLADLMRTESGGKPTWVLPNSVRPGDWRVKKRQRLTISLTGSNTHGADWAVLAEVLPQIMASYPQVDFMVGGYLPDYLACLRMLYPTRFIWQEWVPFKKYPAVAGQAHIVLCPVDPEDRFNWSKSGLKAIEGMAAKSAVIATDLHIYRDVITHGRTGLLVAHTPNSWLTAIRSLIEDGELRNGLAARGQVYVNRHHNIFTNANLWWNAFREIKEL
jgi:glycosyltransferase involved in cell wall biosynthesis